jgi:UDP-N-acetylmuramoyl-L-alanyl-D-glutamate--2,6-diaminopimelate ligase
MSKTLQQLLSAITTKSIVGNPQVEITSITCDSREASQGALFIAVKGVAVDAHRFIPDVVKRGAAAIVCEDLPVDMPDSVTFVQVADSHVALAVIASEWFDRPSEKLKLVGVTGTNGKTTIATLLYRLFTDAGYACGLLSTIENIVSHEVIPSTHTTPDPIELNSLLHKMVESGCEYAFMEVSSHSIDQDRIAGLHFAGGIFTNLTHDHLDYHKTMANYRNAKKKFFDNLPETAFALTNLDDKNGAVMLQNTRAKKLSYALKHDADFKGIIMESHFDGMLLKVNGTEVYTQLVGRFNASNLLAIYGAALSLGFDKDELLVEISKLHGANGRFDMVYSDNGIVGIIDYAHTPDALQNVLETINEVRCHKETLFTIVGCGGNRDTTKRPEMAAVAVKLSDRVILTSDNPRNEDPDEIIRQMKAGITAEDSRKVLSITNRHEAIRTGVALAKKGDIILIAGKGHENYQEINGIKNHFDDKEELSKAFKEAL